MSNPIILALDSLSVESALSLVEVIKKERKDTEEELVWGLKLTSMVTLDGFRICELLKKSGFRVMADMKFYDIPSIMISHIRTLYDSSDCDIITVHTSARFNEKEVDNSYLAGVRVLTIDEEMSRIHTSCVPIDDVIIEEATFAMVNGYGYFVCAGSDLKLIEKFKFKKIATCIRPTWSGVKNDNLVTSVTPKGALEDGADLIVIGRPITHSENPIDNLLRLNEDIASI